MVESRCGILCGGCPYQEKAGCKGCTNIDKPIWGESCPVKSCCEQRGLNHCGECGEFVCGLLHQFAHDPEQGDGGKRLERCKAWAGKD